METVKAQSVSIKAALTPTLSAQDSFCAVWEASIRWFMANLEAYQYIQQIRDTGMIPDEIIQQSNAYFDFYYTAIHKGLSENAIKPYPVETGLWGKPTNINNVETWANVPRII